MATAEFSLPQSTPSDRRSPLRWITRHAARHAWLFLVLLTGAFGNAILAGVMFMLIGQGLNAVLESPPDLDRLLVIALGIAVSQIVRGGLQLARNYSAEVIGQRLEAQIRDELYLSLLGKSMTFHSLQPLGDTMARATNDVREINLMFSPGLNLVIGSANFLLAPLLLAPRYHPSLVLVPALFIVSYFFSLWQYLRELRPIAEDARLAFGRMNTHLAEALDGIEVVKGHAQETAEVDRFGSFAGESRNAYVRQGDVEARFLPLLLMGIAEAAALLQALLLFQRGVLDVGEVVGFFGMIQLFGFPTFVSLYAYSQVALGMASARRVFDLINRKTELDRNPGGHAAPMRGEIVFDDVSFAHQGQQAGLQHVSFRVAPGQTIALVGQTGSGKSTLIRLLNRIHDVDQGAVRIDGVDVRQWDLEALRQQISIIEQDVFLFSRSVAENIAFGRPQAGQEEIEAAAHAAQAHDFITALPEGYATIVGERGVTLSGGQRQRIALARAFLTNPSILVLDDSTSSIDSATEDQIQRAIFRAAAGRTTIIITHRLSQIRWADQILVLRKGQLAAHGAHAQLLESSAAYRRIFRPAWGESR
jgi:ATP-binding cassette subfamily B protein